VLMKGPAVIIMDEPTLGIDPTGAKEFLTLIVKLSKEESITVLLSSHYLLQVQEICDRIGLFVKGKIIAIGDISSLSQQLFANEPFLIEATIQYPASSVDTNSVSHLQQKLSQIEGVKQIVVDNGQVKIFAARDIAPQVAKTIVYAGFDLLSLSRREHGLEDIYQHYFEKEEVDMSG
jgi:ABC-2 type transport system ATP-binding protein